MHGSEENNLCITLFSDTTVICTCTDVLVHEKLTQQCIVCNCTRTGPQKSLKSYFHSQKVAQESNCIYKKYLNNSLVHITRLYWKGFKRAQLMLLNANRLTTLKMKLSFIQLNVLFFKWTVQI